MSDFANLNSDVRLVPDGTVPLLFRASQYDVGRIFNVHVVDDDDDWVIPSDASAVLNAVKPDGNVYTATLSATTSYAQIVTTEQLTAVAGLVLCEVRFTLSSGEDLGTANFYVAVEASPLEGGTVSDSELGSVQTAIAALEAEISDAESELNTLVSTASGYADDAADSASAAAASESNAADSATLAESWAVGGTDSRDGEDTDNAKYYAEIAGANAASDLGFFWGTDGYLYGTET